MKQKQTHKPVSKQSTKTPVKKELSKTPTTPFFLDPYLQKHGLWITLGLVSLLILLIFHNFILGNVYYLFKDIGSDTVNQSFPIYKSLTKYLNSEGFPLWSFDQGMGQEIISTSLVDPFYWIIYFFGENNVMYGMLWTELTKIILTAFVFFQFLKVLNLSNTNALIGALLYSFSGFMIVGGSWIVFSAEACYLAILLLGFEKLFKQNSWYLFPIAIALICIMRPFDLYFYGLFLIIYFLFRHFSSDDFSWKNLFFNGVKLFGLALLGIFISTFFFVSGVQLMLDSPRVSGSSSYFNLLLSRSIFFIEQPIHYVTVLFRTFSNDMLGNGSNFKGWGNYLEAPMTYIGILPLVIFSQVFTILNKKKKIVYAIFLAVFIIPIIFPWFRYAFWAFAGDYYRGFSILVSITLLFYSLQVIHEIEKQNKISLVLLLINSAILLVLLYYPFIGIDQVINKPQQLIVALLIIVYSILIYLLSYTNKKGPVMALIVIVVFVELGYFNYKTVNDRVCITHTERLQKVGYNDYTVEALDFIKKQDNGFFRMNKDYNSGPTIHNSYNDAKAQGYFGTMSYYSFNQKYYIRFLEETEVIHKGNETESRWAPGLSGRPLLQIFGSVKYNLSKNPRPVFMQMGYDSVTQIGDVKVLQNRFFLPLGNTYDKYITISKYQKLSRLQKDLVLLQAVVAEEPVSSEYLKLKEFSITDTMKIPTWEAIGNACHDRKRDTLQITHFSNNKINGTIDIMEPQLLFFSIPFDRGWNARIDGKEAKPILCNLGFNGLILDPGRHSIELYYKPPYFATTIILSFVGLLIYLILVVIDISFKRKKQSKLNSVTSEPSI